jgi:hypothetical protein
VGGDVLSVAALERGHQGLRWRAWVDGHPCDLFFDRATRERLIASGATAELAARVFPPALMDARLVVLLTP